MRHSACPEWEVKVDMQGLWKGVIAYVPPMFLGHLAILHVIASECILSNDAKILVSQRKDALKVIG